MHKEGQREQMQKITLLEVQIKKSDIIGTVVGVSKDGGVGDVGAGATVWARARGGPSLGSRGREETEPGDHAGYGFV